MQKITKFIVAFAIMLIAIPLGGNIVKADEGNNSEGDFIEEFDSEEEVYYESSLDIDSNFDNPVTLFYKDDKKYIQMEGNMASYIDSLTIDGDEVIWGEVGDDDTYNIQFEIDGNLSDKRKFTMHIDTGSDYGTMDHTTELSFIKIKEAVVNDTINVSGGEGVRIKSDDSFQLNMPNNLPNDVELTIDSVEDIEKLGDLKIAGEVYDFNFDGLDGSEGTFVMTMGYDADEYNSDAVDIYHFDEGKWSAVGGEAKDGKVTANVDRFSKYGVFAIEEEEEEEKSGDTGDEFPLKPDNASKIGYNIMKDDGSAESISNDFFAKPANLFEKDGNKYVQLKIENGDMIKELGNDYGKALIVEENDDGSVIVQLRVNDDLSDMLLNMHIVVPGGAIPGFPGYDNEHDAILVFDKDSQEEIDVGDHMLVGTNNSDNGNGVYVEDSPSNELGGEGENPEETPAPETPKTSTTNPDKDLNPKTGDSNNIALYLFLLIGSLIPLGFLYKNRRFN